MTGCATEAGASGQFQACRPSGRGRQSPASPPARARPARRCARHRRWVEVEVGGLRSRADSAMPFLHRPDAPRPARVDGHGSLGVGGLSPDIVHKSEVGGVKLNLINERAVREAVADIFARARAVRPDAHITGVTIHPMVVRPKARELIAGIADDPTFGSVIVFGRGGTAVEVIGDKALALPPLDLKLAGELIARTRVSRVLKAYHDVPAADIESIALLLVKLAQLAADLPQLRELDLNPVLADQNGLIAVDARIAVAAVEPAPRGRSSSRFAIRPYPKEWERHTELRDGTKILVRPVRPEDEP